jgi:hypothetical protein
MNAMHTLYQIFLSEQTKKKIEKTTLYVALTGFSTHLILIYLSKFSIIHFLSDAALFKNPISAIYTPFSFILIYEVYLLIYYLQRSFTTYITKQYEIITLIIIRKLFKDLSVIELSSNWFEIKNDLQFTYDILASIILFYLIYQFQKQGKRRATPEENNPKIERFIRQKKMIALVMVPVFFTMASITLVNWLSEFSFDSNGLNSFETVNNLFFDEFFTVLILVDVILLLISFFYTDKFHKIIRNSGFVVSTILLRMYFGATGLTSTVLIVGATLFGLTIILIHNKYEMSDSYEKK